MTKDLDLFLKDFGLSTFADDILSSTLHEPIKNNDQIINSNKKVTVMNNDDDDEEDDGDDDDDIPLSKCIPHTSLKSPIQTNTCYPNDNDDEDDEDLVPIAVLQDPKAKSCFTFQSAAEKYKKSILDRDPQLKTTTKKPNSSSFDRRLSLNPSHYSSSTTNTTTTVIRSVSAGQKHRYTSKQLHSYSHYNPIRIGGGDDDGDDDDDDIPLFQTCLLSSMNMKSTNVKVSLLFL
ncbi:hypothetical protein BJ944DRAFT_270691 [Cunninghamella echinulata]|nr:hypothetical protein BJ944DRAFT_270691 [Cunninghamella echinulata]